MTSPPEPIAIAHDPPDGPPVRAVLHPAAAPGGAGLVLAHGAGSSREAPLLVALARALAERGVTVLRCDLPFRQLRPAGPPRRGDATRDRDGLRQALVLLRERTASGPLVLGGHSYGGRQASVLVAAEPGLADGLLLLAYPLHPPGRAGDPRTAHFARIRTPVLFVHGGRDPFGTLAELEAARAVIPAPSALLPIESAGHDLVPRRRDASGPEAAARSVAATFPTWVEAARRKLV